MKLSAMFSRFPFLALALAVFGFGLSACSDDPAAPPEPTTTSKVMMMHANAGISGDVQFKYNTDLLATLAYGASNSANVRDGSRRISVRATDGSELAGTDVTLDSTTSTWVLFSGTLTQKDAYRVSTKKITPSTGNAAVRIIHASHNAGDLVVKINDLNGLSFTQNNIAYKSGTSYVALPVATTTSLVVVKSDNLTVPLVTVSASGGALFQAGKSYTVVIYGSTDPQAAASVKITSKVVED